MAGDVDSDPDRIEALARVAAALSSAGSIGEVMHELVESLAPAICDGCEVALPDEHGKLARVAAGPGDYVGREQAPVPDIREHPLQVVWATGKPMQLDADDPDDLVLFGPPEIPTSARALGMRKAVVAPITGRDGLVGVLGAAVGTTRGAWRPGDVEFVTSVARLAGIAIENVRAAEGQRRTVRRLERAVLVSSAFGQALDADGVAEVLVDVARSELGADTGVVFLHEGDNLRLVAHTGNDDIHWDRWRELPLAARMPVTDAFRSRQPVVCSDRDTLVAAYPGIDEQDFVSQALLAVPLMAGGEVVGAAGWAFDHPVRLGDDDLSFLELVGDQAGAEIGRIRAEEAKATAREAVEQARQHLQEALDEQRRVAETLQASLLPPTLPVIDGLELHACYWPAGDQSLVGGDFYDVFQLRDARWGIIVGDVCGKGVEAAAVTAAARYSALAAALHVEAPAEVLRWVHDTVAAHPSDTFCTLAYAVLDSGPRPRTLTVSLGGHAPGLRVSRDGVVTDLGSPGTLLGVMDPVLQTEVHPIELGDLVAFFTDGITDAPADELFDRDELSQLLRSASDQPLECIGAQLRAQLDARRPRGSRDDVALVLLRVLA